MEFCELYRSCTIRYNPITEKVEIGRCCMKTDYSLQEYTLDEWEKIENKVEELNKYVNVWNNRNGERSLRPFICHNFNPKLTECFYDKDLESFNLFEVALDYSCNARCTFCVYKDLKEKVEKNKLFKKLKLAYFDTLNNILKNASEGTAIRLTDHGEPLLWKSDVLNFLNNAHENQNISKIKITTNGLGLLDNDIFSSLKQFASERRLILMVSLNALSPELHTKTMGIGSFYDICNKLEELSKLSWEVSSGYVVSSDIEVNDISENLHEFKKQYHFPICVSANSFEKEAVEKVQQLKNKFNGEIF